MESKLDFKEHLPSFLLLNDKPWWNRRMAWVEGPSMIPTFNNGPFLYSAEILLTAEAMPAVKYFKKIVVDLVTVPV